MLEGRHLSVAFDGRPVLDDVIGHIQYPLFYIIFQGNSPGKPVFIVYAEGKTVILFVPSLRLDIHFFKSDLLGTYAHSHQIAAIVLCKRLQHG